MHIVNDVNSNICFSGKSRGLSAKWRVFLAVIYAIAAIILICAGVSVFAFGNSSWVYTESGAIEMSQTVLLVLTFLCFVYAFFANPHSNERMITLFFAVLTWVFLLREVDFERLGLPEFMVLLLYGKGRAITVIVGFAIAFIGAATRFKNYVEKSKSFMLSSRGVLTVMTGVFLVIGSFFEHNFRSANSEFFEEGFELLGYLCFITSSVLTIAKVGAKKPAEQKP